MKCPKCESRNYVKDGIIKHKQRYLCRMCGYRYTVKKRAGEISHRQKYFIAKYYYSFQHISYRAVGKRFKISHVSVMNVLKQFKEEHGYIVYTK